MNYASDYLKKLSLETQILLYNSVKFHTLIDKNPDLDMVSKKVLSMLLAELEYGNKVKEVYNNNGITTDYIANKFNLSSIDVSNINFDDETFHILFKELFFTPMLIIQNAKRQTNESVLLTENIFYTLSYKNILGSSIIFDVSNAKIRNELYCKNESSIIELSRYKKI